MIPTTLEELDKKIHGSIQLGSDLNEDDIVDWFYDYYNNVIAPILPIDDIEPVTIVDRGYSLFIRAKGIQYYSIHSKLDCRRCRKVLIAACRQDDIDFNMYISDFGDKDEYSVVINMVVPLVELEEE